MNRALGSILALLLVFPAFAQSQTLPPSRGGTGVSTAPSYGQLLLGNASGGYTLTATSSLGVSAAANDSFATTSADYWKTVRDFFSTTSAQYFVSVTDLFSTTSADYWSSTKGYATFGYLFPSNATSTTLTFSGGLLSIGSTTIAGNATTTGMLGAGSLFLNGERFTDLTGAGLQNAGGALTLNPAGDWTGTFDGLEGSAYLSDAFSTTSASYFSGLGLAFSTTSSDYWETQQPPRGITVYDAWTHPQAGISATTSGMLFSSASSTFVGALRAGHFFGNLTGQASTSLALAANGTNCSAGAYPLGMDASGNVENCTDATTEISSAIATHAADDDAHHAPITLAGTPDYITLSGQQLTRNAIDLAADVTGTLPVTNGGTGATTLNNLITLATHTAGNYLATLTSSGSITVGNSGTENAAATVNLNMANANTWTALQTFGNASSTLFSTSYASSTFYYGGGLATCQSGNFLTWTNGQFGCAADQTGGGGNEFDYPFPSNATSTPLTFSGGLSTTNASTTHVSASGQFFGKDGSSASPSFTFSSDTDTGIWGDGALNFGVNGTHGLTMTAAGILPHIGIFSQHSGSASEATYSFLGDANTGMYRSAADTLNLLAGGFDALVVRTSGASTTLLSIGNTPVATSTVVCKQSGACAYNAIQDAIDAGHTSILVRNGVYSEQVNLAASKTIIAGESLNAIIQCNGATQSPCVTADEDEFTIRNITVREANAVLLGTGIDFSDSALGLIDGVRINNFATSTRAIDTGSLTFYNRIQNSTFFNPRACIEMGGTQPNANWSSWNRCRPMAVNGAFGIYLSDTRGFTSIADDFESTTTAVTSTGIYIDGSSREISFTNPWVEANGTGVDIASGANRVTFTAGSITSNGTDVTDNGTNTMWLNTSLTGTLRTRLGHATSTSMAVTNLAASRPVFTDATNGFTSSGTVGAIEAAVGSQNILLETEIDGCSELAALLDGETGGCNGASGPVFPDGPTFTGTTTHTNLSVSGAVSILGEYFTNFTTYVRSLFSGGTGIALSSGAISFDCSEVEGTGINCSGENITLDATGDWTGTFDGQQGTYYLDRANHTGTRKIWSVTVASTSPAFISGGLLKIPTELDGYTMSAIRCSVQGGTSKVIAVEDESGNSTEDITCGTSVTSDDGSITNASVSAGEEMYIDFGNTSGSVDYVSISVFGQ